MQCCCRDIQSYFRILAAGGHRCSPSIVVWIGLRRRLRRYRIDLTTSEFDGSTAAVVVIPPCGQPRVSCTRILVVSIGSLMCAMHATGSSTDGAYRTEPTCHRVVSVEQRTRKGCRCASAAINSFYRCCRAPFGVRGGSYSFAGLAIFATSAKPQEWRYIVRPPSSPSSGAYPELAAPRDHGRPLWREMFHRFRTVSRRSVPACPPLHACEHGA